jgi:hypothetical protein
MSLIHHNATTRESGDRPRDIQRVISLVIASLCIYFRAWELPLVSR